MVLKVADGFVTQKINRAGETVQHAMSSLSGPVVLGSVVDIKYQGGVGQVSGPGQALGKGR